MTTPLRILWHSNAPWVGSGYGVQSKRTLDLLADLQEQGEPIEDIAVSAFYGLNGGKVMFGERTMYGNPRPNNDPWGNKMLPFWYDDFKANVLISLMDAWVFDPKVANQLNWVPYFPIDHDPMPPEVLDHVQNAWKRIAMSEFGRDTIIEAEMETEYAPHCYDHNSMHPFNDEKRRNAREWMGFEPEHFVFGMVAANTSLPMRKAFSEVFRAFRKVIDRHPNVRLFLHTEPRGSGRVSGMDLIQMSKLMGLQDYIHFTGEDKMETWFGGDAEMAVLYNSIDCLLSPSYGEGFGVPIVEAQACGIPVITQDCTAMTEITRGGICIPKGMEWWTPQMSRQWMPDPDVIADAMFTIYGMTDDEREQMGLEGHQFVLENYDMRVVQERHWKPLINMLADEVGEQDKPVLEREQEAIAV